jgi:hypothetical protein
VEDAKTHKRALVMVTEVVRRRNVKSGIVYYRYKVCSRYGHIEKTFDRRQLLHDENLTAALLGIDVTKEGFQKKDDYCRSNSPPRQTWISYNMQVQKRRLCSECQLCVQEKWKALQ